MKGLISVVVGVIMFYLVIFQLDPWLVSLVMDAIPASAGEWFALIKIVVWVIVLFFTLGFSIWISFLIGGLVRVALD